PTPVAEYRKHGGNMSGKSAAMLKVVLGVLDRQEVLLAADSDAAAALRKGREIWRDYYVAEMLDRVRTRWQAGRPLAALLGLAQGARWSPARVREMLAPPIKARVKRSLPPPMVRRISRWRAPAGTIPTGTVRFGDLGRTQPISRRFGFDRGTPVDRYYIERF